MLRKFAGNSIFYVLGMMLNRGLSFLLLPLYTRHLTPADYGILAICASVSAILTAILTLYLSSSVSLFYFKLDAVEYRKLMRTVWLWLLIVPLLVVLSLDLIGSETSSTFFTMLPWHPYLRMAVWISYFSVLVDLPLALLMSEQRAVRYVLFTVLSFLMTTGLLIYFVAFRGEGAFGSLRAQLISGVVTTLVAHWIVLRRCWRWERPWFERQYLVAALKLCVPLLPHGLALWVLNISDRWILGHYVPLADIGLYNLAYTLGMAVHLFGMGFNLAYTPLYFQNADDEHFRMRLPRILSGYLLIMTWVTLAVSLLALEVLRLMTRPAYYEAASLVPWIAASNWFLGGIYHQCMVVLENRRRTGYVLLLTGPPSLLNVALNLLLIPRFGVVAAAFNTLLAFALMAFLSLLVSRKWDKLPFPWLAIAQMVALAGAAYWVGNTWLSLPSLGISILLKISLLLTVGLLSARMLGFSFEKIWALRRGSPKVNTVS
jgi:O-antigen/teichoic acid export membrane protein